MLKNFRDRLLQVRIQRDEKKVKVGFFVIIIILILLLVNIAVLNFALLNNKVNPNIFIQNAVQSAVSPFPEASPTSEFTPTPTLQILPTINYVPQEASLKTSSKDYFIPLGSGTNQTDEWTDVPGVQTLADFSLYENIKEVRFEASVYVPTANQFVMVRLYNDTDKHPVWYSEVRMDGGASAYLISPPLVYDKGSKMYKVQMKSQLKALTNLVQAKIHITLQ